MALTYEPLATTTIASSGTTSTITFNSISGSYTDLILVCVGNASAGVASTLRFNNDSGTNYSETGLEGNGSAASSFRGTNFTGTWGGSYYNTTTPTVAIINLPNYSNSTTYKNNLARVSYADGFVDAYIGMWRSTAAITRLDLSVGSKTFNAGFTATLYGVKAA